MKSIKLLEQIVELRIMLQNICDGFNTEQFNKQSMLTMDKKVLFVLSKNADCPPSKLIETLGIAKSNLALLCKSMVDNGQISVSKSDLDKRNVFYNITKKGQEELNQFYCSMANEASLNLNKREQNMIEKRFDEIIEFINKKYK